MEKFMIGLLHRDMPMIRLGTISTRYKDIFDLYYLSSRVRKEMVYDYLTRYVVNA